MLAVDLPVQARINAVSITERMPPLMTDVVGHATGLLTMKHWPNGTVPVGGGWQDLGEVTADSLPPNPALAQFAAPALGDARVLRSCTGFEAHVPDDYPLAGAQPRVPDASVLGRVRSGHTIGPDFNQLIGDFILGREPETSLFDPGRDLGEGLT